ncbi:MAG: sodium:solute symporter family protein [Vicinamibacterales bacterium]
MTLTALDWVIVALSFGGSLATGVLFTRQGGQSVQDFFLSGRQLPWWLAGTSMVATTFAADTPLAVAGIVARQGIAGNWIWWSAAAGSMMTVFLFARLWRRAGIVTDVELAERRYHGRPAAALRVFRALYLGLPINCVVMGWVNLAMAKVLSVMLGWNELTAVLVSLAVTGIYAALAGLWGVVVTDFLQFTFAMGGTLALAWFVLRAPGVGGLDGLVAALPEPTLAFVPDLSGVTAVAASLSAGAFLTYLGVQWWASWYPGQEPGGGGYVAQRMMSARSERDALTATLWFTVAHYCLRPWPWILVGLATLVLYPEATDKEAAYVLAMRDHLGPGWRGLLLGAFFAAYMSTISSQLNWGTSYLVNDVYRRFVRVEASEGHYVAVSRATTLGLMALSAVVTFYLESIRQAWEFVLESGAGIGLVLMLRWYWWRVNAWSEVSAMIAAAVGFALVRLATDWVFPASLVAVVAWTTIWWLVVTALTAPEPDATLDAFYTQVSPPGPGWGPVARRLGRSPAPVGPLLSAWLAGTAMIYAVLFGVGHALLHSLGRAVPYFVVAAIAAWLVARALPRVDDPGGPEVTDLDTGT